MYTQVFLIAQKNNHNEYIMGTSGLNESPLIFFTLQTTLDIFKFAESSLVCICDDLLLLLTASIDLSSLPQQKDSAQCFISYIEGNMTTTKWNVVGAKVAENIQSDSYKIRLMQTLSKNI